MTDNQSRPDWVAALLAAEAAGFLVEVQQLAPNVHSCSVGKFGWGGAARELAYHLPGQLLPGRAGGVGWKCGGGPMNGRLVDADSVQGIMAAREAIRGLIPLGERPEIPFSVGSCARLALQWAVGKQEPEKSAEALLTGKEGDSEDRRIQYHDCRPGLYPRAVMYDCTSYYFRLLRRLPSLRVSVLPDRLIWLRMGADERSRWQDALDAVEGAKVLRNALWGSMLGSYERRAAWTRDKKTGRPRLIRPCFGPGPNRPAAIVLARSAWEMCRRASEEVGSVYSTVDSVVSTSGARPKVWDSVNLPWGPKTEGAAHIVALGVWRVGPHRTEPYQWYTAGRYPIVGSDVGLSTAPQVEFYRQWL